MKNHFLLLLIILGCLINLGANCYFMRNPDHGVKLLPPTQLTAVAGDGQVWLKWQATRSTPEAEYQIYRSTSTNGPFQKVATTHMTSYKDTKLNNRIIYYYKITATLNNVAESDASNVVKAVPSSTK